MNNKEIFDQQDWRKHTCGECGWDNKGFCRRNTFAFMAQITMCDGQWSEPSYLNGVSNKDPACPAFIPKEKPNDPRY